jgi:hypothetical protein
VRSKARSITERSNSSYKQPDSNKKDISYQLQVIAMTKSKFSIFPRLARYQISQKAIKYSNEKKKKNH